MEIQMNKKTEWTRRLFAAALAGSPAIAQTSAAPQAAPPSGAPQAPAAPPRRPQQPEPLPFADTLVFTRKDFELHATPYPLSQVRLLAGPCLKAADANRAYLMRIAPDRLLHTFRLNAGLGSSARPLGGWEEPKGELRGHTMGHYLSACALRAASAGDKEMKARGDELVSELAKCQAKLAGGYLSAYPTEWYDRLEKRQRVWAPFYTYHKIFAGLLDMHVHTGNRQALEVATGMAAWADQWSASKPEARMQDILREEFGGMSESLFNLAALTSDLRWAKAGDRFQKKEFLTPLAQHRDELRGLSHEYARPAGDRRGAALRTHWRSALPRGGGILLVRRVIRAHIRDRRKQHPGIVADLPGQAGRRVADRAKPPGMLLLVQHDEVDAPPLLLDRRSALLRLL